MMPVPPNPQALGVPQEVGEQSEEATPPPPPPPEETPPASSVVASVPGPPEPSPEPDPWTEQERLPSPLTAPSGTFSYSRHAGAWRIHASPTMPGGWCPTPPVPPPADAWPPFWPGEFASDRNQEPAQQGPRVDRDADVTRSPRGDRHESQAPRDLLSRAWNPGPDNYRPGEYWGGKGAPAKARQKRPPPRPPAPGRHQAARQRPQADGGQGPPHPGLGPPPMGLCDLEASNIAAEVKDSWEFCLESLEVLKANKGFIPREYVPTSAVIGCSDRRSGVPTIVVTEVPRGAPSPSSRLQCDPRPVRSEFRRLCETLSGREARGEFPRRSVGLPPTSVLSSGASVPR